jgi:hypothetical protein
MKELKKKEVIEKDIIYGYEAIDGTIFHVNDKIDAESARIECEKYDKSAMSVALSNVLPFKIAEMSQYDITNGEGSEEYKIEVFKPNNINEVNALKTYLCIKDKEAIEKFKDIEIGKEIMICWDYDEKYFWTYTLEEWLKGITDKYYKFIEAYKENKDVK